MKRFLFVGLGNPGKQYARSRHNAGWIALDTIIKLWSEASVPAQWRTEKKFAGETLHLNTQGHEFIFLKPQTFMNESGSAVAAAMKWYLQIDPSEPAEFRQVVVFHDDLDLTTGQYKLQFGIGPKIHNGVNSVRHHLNGNFWHARLGVDSRDGMRTIPGQAYVLQPFSNEELSALTMAVETLAEELPYQVLQ